MATCPEKKVNLTTMEAQPQETLSVGYPSTGYNNYGPQTGVQVAPSSPPLYVDQQQQQQTYYPPPTPVNTEDQCCGVLMDLGEANPPEGPLPDYYARLANVKVDFGSVFQEPKDSQCCPIFSTYNGYIYQWSRRGFYVFFTCLLGPILAFVCGLLFGLLEFAFIWLLNPAIKVTHMSTRCVSQIWQPLVRIILDPFFESYGQMFLYRNAGRFTERSYKLDVKGIDLSGASTRPHLHSA